MTCTYHETDTKPNTNNSHGKIPKPNRLGNMREIPTFYQILSLTLARIHNTNKIQNALALNYQIPSWYRFGIGTYTKKIGIRLTSLVGVITVTISLIDWCMNRRREAPRKFAKAFVKTQLQNTNFTTLLAWQYKPEFLHSTHMNSDSI